MPNPLHISLRPDLLHLLPKLKLHFSYFSRRDLRFLVGVDLVFLLVNLLKIAVCRSCYQHLIRALTSGLGHHLTAPEVPFPELSANIDASV